MTERVRELAKQLRDGVWDSPAELFDAVRLAPAEIAAVLAEVAGSSNRGGAAGRPSNGSDQPTIPGEDWGFPIEPGTKQPTFW